MMQAMDQRTIEGAMGDASDGSEKRQMVRAVGQGSIERATDGASNGKESNRRSEGWCKRFLGDHWKGTSV
jgi:hypothetical protein